MIALLNLVLIFNIGLLCMVSCLKSSTGMDMGKVIFSNVLFRHGDRTPVDPYPTDPYKDPSFWPVGFGHLTNKGKEQEYELGKWLRRRYNSLFTDLYNYKIVHVQSTDFDRTLMSAATNLAAIYPPGGPQVWNTDLKWQPIPIHTVPSQLDKMMGRAPCPAFMEEYKRVLHSPEVEALTNKYKDMFKVLTENTGLEVNTLGAMGGIYDTLFIENLYNLTLPDWTRGVFPEPLEEAAKNGYRLPTWNVKLARLKTGLLLQDMINHMVDKKNNKSTYNVWMYSAHDLTVACVLNTLRVFEPHCPPYASAVMLELRVDTAGQHNVAVIYHNTSAEEPLLLTVPGCTALCPLDQFIKLCEPILPQDWDKECNTAYFINLSSLRNSVSLFVLAVLSLLVMLTMIVFTSYKGKRERHTHCNTIYQHVSLVPFGKSKGTYNPSDESFAECQVKI